MAFERGSVPIYSQGGYQSKWLESAFRPNPDLNYYPKEMFYFVCIY